MVSLTSTLSLFFLFSVINGAKPSVSPPAQFYSSSFLTPPPPNITAEFQANWQQHKFDANIDRHISSGFLYLSPTYGKVRLDAASEGSFESSLFDFTNTTAQGLVYNVILSYTGSITSPTCSYFFVSPFIIPFPTDILVDTGAVYTGYQDDELYGDTRTWTFQYGNVIVRMFLDATDTLVRYDIAAPGTLRTFTTTRFFNIMPGPLNATTFQTLCLKT